MPTRRLCYQVATSLDGFIAGPEGEFDWIAMDPDIDFKALFARFDALIMGRKTWEIAGSSHGGGSAGLQTYVVSKTLRSLPGRNVTLISDDIEARVSALKAQPGKDIWLYGGGQLFASLLEAGLVDTVEPAVIPVLLGGGVPFLAPTKSRHALRLQSQRVYPKTGTTLLTYDVVPAARPSAKARKPRSRG